MSYCVTREEALTLYNSRKDPMAPRLVKIAEMIRDNITRGFIIVPKILDKNYADAALKAIRNSGFDIVVGVLNPRSSPKLATDSSIMITWPTHFGIFTGKNKTVTIETKTDEIHLPITVIEALGMCMNTKDSWLSFNREAVEEKIYVMTGDKKSPIRGYAPRLMSLSQCIRASALKGKENWSIVIPEDKKLETYIIAHLEKVGFRVRTIEGKIVIEWIFKE